MKTDSIAGFTFIELLIGSLVSLMILVTVGSLFFVFTASYARVSETDTLNQSMYDIETDMGTAIRWAKSVTIPAPGVGNLQIITADDEKIIYMFDQAAHKLYKNKWDKSGVQVVTNVALNNNEIQVLSLQLQDYSVVSTVVSMDVQVGLQHAKLVGASGLLHFVSSQRYGTSQVFL